MAHPSSPATVLPERAWQDCIVNLPETPPVSPCQAGGSDANNSSNINSSSSSNSNNGSNQNTDSFTLGSWNFHDPHKKYSCTCFKYVLSSIFFFFIIFVIHNCSYYY